MRQAAAKCELTAGIALQLMSLSGKSAYLIEARTQYSFDGVSYLGQRLKDAKS
ncbi:MAG: hypothetical protein SFV15_03250 [Polyangiaceae bacterium]|nr:hypothetical protein [Polyangiaceae bacterium]